jgi:hypothetical protein
LLKATGYQLNIIKISYTGWPEVLELSKISKKNGSKICPGKQNLFILIQQMQRTFALLSILASDCRLCQSHMKNEYLMFFKR